MAGRKKQPWFKWFPDDWLSDEALMGCSFSAQGLWMTMLCLMHKCERRGYLEIGGKAVTAEKLAKMRGKTVREIQRAIEELVSEGVASRDENGVLYNRKMVRETALSETRRHVGGLGGNPALLNQNPPGQENLLKQNSGAPAYPRSGSGSGSDSKGISSSENPSVSLSPTGGGTGEGEREVLLNQNQTRGRAVDYADGQFDRFWRAGPWKAGERSAREMWDRIFPTVETVEQMLVALERQRRSAQWTKEGGRFIPAPAKWLKDEYWKIDLPEAGAAKTESVDEIAERLKARRA